MTIYEGPIRVGDRFVWFDDVNNKRWGLVEVIDAYYVAFREMFPKGPDEKQIGPVNENYWAVECADVIDGKVQERRYKMDVDFFRAHVFRREDCSHHFIGFNLNPARERECQRCGMLESEYRLNQLLEVL